MNWDWRNERSGKKYRSFSFYDSATGKASRLTKEEVPSAIKYDVGPEADKRADEFAMVKQAGVEAVILKIERRLAWQKKYYNFEKLLESFEPRIKELAPESWENTMYFLKQYGFAFFLNDKECNNLNNWPVHFEDFRKWLQKAKKIKGKGVIAYSTMNHCISALNTFMAVMKEKGKIETLEKCTKFPEHLLKRRTIDDVLTAEEKRLIHSELEKISPDYADFFLFLLETGLRLSEGLGISLHDCTDGPPENKLLKKLLGLHGFEAYGSIMLYSQVKNPSKPRGDNGVIFRKPLKGRKRMDSDTGRTIPIMDKKVYNILADRYEKQLKLQESGKYGPDDKNYLLFDGVNQSNFWRALVQAYSKCKVRFKRKSPHCFRHTFSTELAGKSDGDTTLCTLVLGHKDKETTDRYVHIFEELNRSTKLAVQKKRGMKRVE